MIKDEFKVLLLITYFLIPYPFVTFFLKENVSPYKLHLPESIWVKTIWAEKSHTLRYDCPLGVTFLTHHFKLVFHFILLPSAKICVRCPSICYRDIPLFLGRFSLDIVSISYFHMMSFSYIWSLFPLYNSLCSLMHKVEI